jgi:hypothetical protein
VFVSWNGALTHLREAVSTKIRRRDGAHTGDRQRLELHARRHQHSGDADRFVPGRRHRYSSRGFPSSPPGWPARPCKLYAVSSDAWHPRKTESDLSLAGAPDCIEGVPKGSPDGTRILLFRACEDERFGVTVTDTAGSYRTWIADGYGPDWNPSR